MRAASDCLRRTTPDLPALEYPDDAEEHFVRLHRALGRWTAQALPFEWDGFRGPWLEDQWISRMWTAYRSRPPNATLRAVFGPYIPLLVPWNAIHNTANFTEAARIPCYPCGFVRAVLGVLRPSVPYITVSQSAEGVTAKGELPMSQIPNVLVLSQGGYGHVPVPLLKAPLALHRHRLVQQKRRIVAFFGGSMDHAPFELRRRMCDAVHQFAAAHKVEVVCGSYVPNFRQRMSEALVVLCPRGYGRTSFFLGEALKMGLIPVHVYDERPWVPYAGSIYERVGFTSTVAQLPGVLSTVLNMSTSALAAMTGRISAMTETHFGYAGVLQQIWRFMHGGSPSSDLRCESLPNSTKGFGQKAWGTCRLHAETRLRNCKRALRRAGTASVALRPAARGIDSSGVSGDEDQVADDSVLSRSVSPQDTLPSFHRCSVVSTSASLLGGGLGGTIDASDAVIRLGLGPTLGFEGDVGARTTMRFLSAGFADNRRGSTRALVCAAVSAADAAGSWLIWQTLQRYPSCYHRAVNALMSTYPRARYASMLRFAPCGIKTPSPGLLVLYSLPLLRVCRQVQAFGFDPPADVRQTPNYYFASNSTDIYMRRRTKYAALRARNGGPHKQRHDFKAEYAWLRQVAGDANGQARVLRFNRSSLARSCDNGPRPATYWRAYPPPRRRGVVGNAGTCKYPQC